MIEMIAISTLSKQVLVFLIAAIVTWLLLFAIILISKRLRVMDIPGARSSHDVPMPRIGGLGILIGTAIASLAICTHTPAFYVAFGLGVVIAIASFLDDLFTLPPVPRLVIHFIGAGLLIYLVGLELPRIGLPYIPYTQPMPKVVGLVLATIYVVGFLNFFNFMDGINGISSAQGIIGGITLSIILGLQAESNSMLIAAALAGGCLGFLPHNFPKAKTFMGDVGSTALGFSLAMLTIIGVSRTDTPWISYLIPFSLYLYDGTFTLFKRIIRGENFLKPHREHHYQLLVRSGWSHAAVTGIYSLQFLASSVLAVVYAVTESHHLRLGVLLVLLGWLGMFSILVHKYFTRKRQEHV